MAIDIVPFQPSNNHFDIIDILFRKGRQQFIVPKLIRLFGFLVTGYILKVQTALSDIPEGSFRTDKDFSTQDR
jgi:hypothetical protein